MRLLTQLTVVFLTTPPQKKRRKKEMDQFYLHGTTNPHRDVITGIART